MEEHIDDINQNINQTDQTESRVSKMLSELQFIKQRAQKYSVRVTGARKHQNSLKNGIITDTISIKLNELDTQARLDLAEFFREYAARLDRQNDLDMQKIETMLALLEM